MAAPSIKIQEPRDKNQKTLSSRNVPMRDPINKIPIFWIPAFAGMTVIFLASVVVGQPIEISFKTRDGVKLSGVYLPPKDNNPTVILLHGLDSSSKEWKPLFQPLEDIRWGYVAYTARKGPPWKTQIDDVGAVLKYLRAERGKRDIPIYLAGASLGANVSLNYAVLSRSVTGAILLSPGKKYVDVPTDKIIERADKIKLLILASDVDQYAFESSKFLAQKAPHATIWTDVPPGHGVQMFDKLTIERIIQWLRKQK